MMILRALLILIEVVCGVLLVGVILLQKSKDEGLGLAFGAGVGETLFGSRAGNVLTKITIGLAVAFLVNTALLGVLYAKAATPSLVDRLPVGQPAAPVQDQGTVPLNLPSESTEPAVPTPVESVPLESVPAQAPVEATP